MSKLIKLPSGNTATWKDATDYTLKDRKYVLTDVSKDQLDNINDALDIFERTVHVSVTEWSFDLIPPNIKPESLEQISLADVDALMRAGKDALDAIMPNLIEPENGEPADPKVVTQNSDA